MGMGMIGAIGGLGQGLVNESVAIGKEEDRTKELAAKKDYQQWLLQTQEQFEIRKDARNWSNEQQRAPVKREMAAEDEKSKTRAKVEVEAETADTAAGTKQKMTDAGVSTDDKAVKKATAKLYNERGEAIDAKPAALDPADAAELKSVQSRAGKLEDAITKAKAEGAWSNTPEQKQLASQLAALQLKERAILQKYQSKEGGGAMPDPLKIRAPAGGEPGKKTGMVATGPTNASEAGMKDQVAGPMGADPKALAREIAATQADLAKVTDASSRQQLTAHLEDLKRQQARIGGATAAAPAAPTPAPKPAVAAAPAVTDPTEVLGQELDASRAAYKALTEPSKRPGLAAGAPAREDYAKKVSSLRDKIRQQEKRYADAVGGQSASFATARP